MKDREFSKLVAGGAAILLLFWFAKHRDSGAAATSDNQTQQDYGDPISNMFASNPAAWIPPNVANQQITVDIGNQGFNYLANWYMPLFGFVGVANNGYWSG